MAASAGEIVITTKLNTAPLKAGLKDVQKTASTAAETTGKTVQQKVAGSVKLISKSVKTLKNTVGKVVDNVSNKMDSVIKNVAQKSAAAVTASVSAVVTGAVKCFSDYEQLAGGVDKLFDKAAASVKRNADAAFQTAGMSANQYMEMVTNFSASLITGLGGDTTKAAKVADIAIRDMADNVNTFGTSMSEVEYAYKGFSKQNYTMLDNLKLGYGGTAAEMARLVNDSGVMGKKFKASAKNINKVSFDKLIEAVHVIQVRMKIAGTTSREAAGTLEGSFNSMKASAQNFLTALGNGKDVDGAFQKMVDSAQTWLGNLIPVVKRVVDNIIKMLDEKFPQFMKPAREAVDFVLKNKDTIIQALVAVGGALAAIRVTKFATDILGVMVGAFQATKAIFGLTWGILKLGAALVCNPIGGTIAIIAMVVAAVVALYLKCDWFRNFINGAVQAIVSFVSSAADTIVGIFNSIVGFLKPPFDTIVAIASATINGIITVVGPIVGFIVTMVQGIINTVTPIIQMAISIVSNVIAAIQAVLTPVVGIVSGIVMVVIGVISPIVGFIAGLIGQIIQFIAPTIKFISDVVAAIFKILTPIADWIFKNVLTPISKFIRDVVSPIVGFIAGILKAIGDCIVPFLKVTYAVIAGSIGLIFKLLETIAGWVWKYVLKPISDAVKAVVVPICKFVADAVKTIFGTLFVIAKWVWDNVLWPVSKAFNDTIGTVIKVVGGFVGEVFYKLGKIAGWIWKNVIKPVGDFFGRLWDGICQGLKGMADTIGRVFKTIMNVIKTPINAIIDAINFVIDGINDIRVPDWVPFIGGQSADLPRIPRLAKGGFVAGAGTATSDSIPAMLSNGEYVINARAVDLIGRDTLDNLNAGKTEPAYRGGGSSTVNNFFQFDRKNNSRWQYEQITRGAM